VREGKEGAKVLALQKGKEQVNVCLFVFGTCAGCFCLK
jgi:hypothetical protein